MSSFPVLLADEIQNGNIKITKCKILQLLKNIEIPKHSTASSSVIILGDLKYKTTSKDLVKLLKNRKIPTVLKISFETDEKKDNSQQVEIEIYEKVINDILRFHYSPNTVGCLASFRCDYFYDSLHELIDSQRKRNVFETILKEIDMIEFKEGEEEVYNFNHASFLLLEKVNGQKLNEWMNQTTSGKQDIVSMMFQVLYTLQVFNLFGLRHNDLHPGNIFIQNGSTTTYYTYFVTDEIYFAIPVKDCVKIYDFDLSATKEIKNTKLDTTGFCVNFGICNNKNLKFDAYTFIKYLVDAAKQPEMINEFGYILDFALYCGKQEFWEKRFGFYGRLCNLKADNKGDEHCDGNWVPDDKTLKSLPEMLMSPLFKPYVHRLPEFDPKYLPKNNKEFQRSNIYLLPCVNKKLLVDKLMKVEIKEIEFK